MNTYNQGQITIRRAEHTDIPALADVTSACFSDDILWQVRQLSYRYWKVALGSGSVETWLWLVEGRTAGFSVVVFDLATWVDEKRKLRYGPSTRLLALIKHPGLIVRKLDSTARLLFRSHQHASNQQTTPLNQFPQLESGIASLQLVQYGGIYCDPAALAWGELAGVLPAYRKFGLALDILRFNESRARELGCAAIGGVVEAEREAWCWIHERLHYLPALSVLQHGRRRTTYIKILDPTRSEIRSSYPDDHAKKEVVVIYAQ